MSTRAPFLFRCIRTRCLRALACWVLAAPGACHRTNSDPPPVASSTPLSASLPPSPAPSGAPSPALQPSAASVTGMASGASSASSPDLLPESWVGSWHAGMTVYSNSVPGAPRPDPILLRDVELEVRGDGSLAWRVTERASQGFSPVGAGSSCDATAQLSRKGERFGAELRSTTCIRARSLPSQHEVSMSLASPCILKVKATPTMAGGIEEMGFVKRGCKAAR